MASSGFSATTSKRLLRSLRDAQKIKLIGKSSVSRYLLLK